MLAALRAVYWRLASHSEEQEEPRRRQQDGGADATREGQEEQGRAGNALFLSFELEQLFEELQVERLGPPPQAASVLEGAVGLVTMGGMFF